MKFRHPTALVALIPALLPNVAFGQSFFLSTERVVAPGEPARVKLEAQNISSLDLRLYKIEDPAKYFDGQADLHRPREALQRPKASQRQALIRGAERGLNQLRANLRRHFKQVAKDALRETVPSAVPATDRGAQPVRVTKSVPALADHPLVDAWTETLGDGDGWKYAELELPIRQPGVYLVEGVYNSRVAHTVVIISSVALVTKQSATTLMVWAIDPKTGEPRPGTDVTVKVRGESRGQQTTGADGLARFALQDSAKPVVYGQFDDSFTLLDPRFFRANVEAPRVYLFTERPVYRAGQTVYLKGFARSIANEQYGLPTTEAGTDVPITIVDARGRTYLETTASLSDRGSFDAEFALPDTPAYGTWTVFAELDGGRHGGEFKVLAFEKPEVKLTVRLNQPTLRAGDTVRGDVVGRYLYGAPYPDQPVKISVTRTKFYVPWYVDTDYEWYYSEAEYRNTQREVVQETTCELDNQGSCPFSFTAPADSDDYTYVVEAVAQDPNGRTVVGTAKATVTQGAFRLTIEQPAAVVEPGAPQTIIVRAVDYAGLPVQTDVQVVVRARRPSTDGVVNMVEALADQKPTDAAGEAKFSVDPRTRGYYEIVATAKDDRQSEIRAESFLFAAEGANGVAMRPADLTVVTDKKSYFVGQTAVALILSPAEETSVLFTVEGGDVYDAKVLKTAGHATVVEVPIGDRQSPNFFLGVTAVIGGQLYSRTQSVIVPPRQKILQVEVAPDRPNAEPGDEVTLTVTVTDAEGQPVPNAEIALGVVDEAIYSISPDIAVPLEAFFFPRKRNDVRLGDSLTFRFFGRARDAMAAQSARRAASDYAFGALKPEADDRDEFKDTAGWWPSLTTDAAGRVSVKLTVPDNLTSWRATARVVSPSTQVGSSTGRIVTKKPLIVRLALPRSVSEGDTGQGQLIVQNLTGRPGKFSWAIEADQPLIEWTFPPAEGEATPSNELEVGALETARVPFTWNARAAGDVSIRVRAEGEGLKDQVVRTYRVRPWSDYATVVATGTLNGDGATWSESLRLPLSVDPAQANLDIVLTSSPIAAVQASLPDLVGFPYGCTEQTMSRFFPLLVVKASMDRFQLEPTELTRAVPEYATAGVSRLAQLQNRDGTWGWFEEGSDPWMTAWVIDGLTEARALGVKVDDSLTSRGLDALRRRLNGAEWPPHMRAFAVYAMAKAGQPSPAMIQRLLEDDQAGYLSSSGLAYTLMAAQLLNDQAMIDAARTRLLSPAHLSRPEDGQAVWCDRKVKEADLHPTECTALAVRALTTETSSEAADAVRDGTTWLLGQFDGAGFGSTRQTALAVRALVAATSKLEQPPQIEWSLDGADQEPVTFANPQSVARLSPATPLSRRKIELTFRQAGEGRTLVHVRAKAPERKTTFEAQRNGITIRREYRQLEGAEGRFEPGRSSRRFVAGDPVLVVLKITARRPQEHVMIEIPHPGGLAPVLRDGGIKIVGVQRQPYGTHREYRPDRTAFFVRRLEGKAELSYMMRATLPGRYRTLPARAESMYLPAQANGRSLSTEIEVTPRP